MLVLLIGTVEGTPENAYYLQDKPFCPPVHPDDPSTNSDPNILPDLASTSTVNSSGLYEMPSLLMAADLLLFQRSAADAMLVRHALQHCLRCERELTAEFHP